LPSGDGQLRSAPPMGRRASSRPLSGCATGSLGITDNEALLCARTIGGWNRRSERQGRRRNGPAQGRHRVWEERQSPQPKHESILERRPGADRRSRQCLPSGPAVSCRDETPGHIPQIDVPFVHPEPSAVSHWNPKRPPALTDTRGIAAASGVSR
jgi:hypothetical protein